METPPIFPPEQQGLYDPATEHDACGVGFVANIKGRKSHGLVRDALQILLNLDHRGAVGADPLVGDGAFSSPGAFGFYPWVTPDKRYYGLLARMNTGSGAAMDSVACGRKLRLAWLAAL